MLAAIAAALLLAGCAGPRVIWPDRDEPAAPPPPSPPATAIDTASDQDPLPFWGSIDCETDSRASWVAAGGDPAPRADGVAQGNDAFRRMTVLDGDDFYGERCELGEDDSRVSPVTFYREGDHVTTYVSIRLPLTFPLAAQDWQGVLQMKQEQPADNGGGTPVLSLGAYDDRWILFHSKPGFTDVDQPIWEAPARANVWTRFAFDTVYSADPAKGSIRVQVDLNADGDFDDPDETGPVLHTNTLKAETAGSPDDGLVPGEPLPSHLRAGIYHNPVIPCPPPAGCAVDIDNVEIVRH